MAIWPVYPTLPVHNRLTRSDDFLLIVGGPSGTFFWQIIEVGLTDRLGRIDQPKLVGVRLINPGKAALPILEVDPVREIVHQGVEEMALLKIGRAHV